MTKEGDVCGFKDCGKPAVGEIVMTLRIGTAPVLTEMLTIPLCRGDEAYLGAGTKATVDITTPDG